MAEKKKAAKKPAAKPAPKPTGETYTGNFYCVKCKESREATGDVVVSNNRRMAKGICPVCGTKMNRILGKA